MLLETLISYFHDKYYTPGIQKLAFHLPHMRILGTHHLVKERHEEFKSRRKKFDVFFRSDHGERIVSLFDHQIKYEYYVGNMSVSIEGVSLERFSASNQASSSFTTGSVSFLFIG